MKTLITTILIWAVLAGFMVAGVKALATQPSMSGGKTIWAIQDNEAAMPSKVDVERNRDGGKVRTIDPEHRVR